MARGQQKLQSQAKAAEKMSKLKKQQGHSATDQKKAAQKALVHVCAICKVSIAIALFITNSQFIAQYYYILIILKPFIILRRYIFMQNEI